jgi:hypothetical protein
VVILTKICDEHKFTSRSAIQVKNQLQAIGIEKKLDVKAKLGEGKKKGERIVDICCNVRLDHSSVLTICDIADRIKESVRCLDNIKCQQSATESVRLCSKSVAVLSE